MDTTKDNALRQQGEAVRINKQQENNSTMSSQVQGGSHE